MSAVVAASAALVACGPASNDEDRPESAAPSSAEGVPEEIEEVDLSEFDEIDSARWEQIARDPDSLEGERIVVFAEVTQFDSATGRDTLRANTGAVQPAGEYELETNTIIVGSEDVVADVSQGDVLRVHAEVVGSTSYENQIGGETTAPVLAARAVEDVGYIDLTADATLGAPVWGEYGGLEVPVTVTNSSDRAMTYSVDVVAENADGSVQLGSASAFVDNLRPGQSAQATANFFEDIPRDATFSVADVERYDS